MVADRQAHGEQTVREMALLGTAVLLAQKFEFGLYGVVAHCSHLPEAQGEKRFRDMDPAAFLRGDPSSFKATLGQLVSRFGSPLLLSSRELDRFVADRNLIAHHYWRTFHARIEGVARREDAEAFLEAFIALAEHLMKVLSGLLVLLRAAAAETTGRGDEVVVGPDDVANVLLHFGHVHRQVRIVHEQDGSVTVAPLRES